MADLMKTTIIQSLPESLQNGETLTATGQLLALVCWTILFGLIGLGVGVVVFRRFRYAVTHLVKDNRKNSSRMVIYQGTVEKQLRVHNQS